jgi:hypothetical protein
MSLLSKRVSKRGLVGFLAAIAASAAAAFGVKCPVDSSSAHFTGKTKVDSATGKVLKLYKCSRGHEFWSVN